MRLSQPRAPEPAEVLLRSSSKEFILRESQELGLRIGRAAFILGFRQRLPHEMAGGRSNYCIGLRENHLQNALSYADYVDEGASLSRYGQLSRTNVVGVALDEGDSVTFSRLSGVQVRDPDGDLDSQRTAQLDDGPLGDAMLTDFSISREGHATLEVVAINLVRVIDVGSKGGTRLY